MNARVGRGTTVLHTNTVTRVRSAGGGSSTGLRFCLFARSFTSTSARCGLCGCAARYRRWTARECRASERVITVTVYVPSMSDTAL
jgi:hypothetical protein